MSTQLYFSLTGNYAERKRKLSEFTREYLEAATLDEIYNDFLRDKSNYKETDQNQIIPGGKRLPYIGWFWRHLEFSSGALPIGHCGEFIGFMANNKWDYPERSTTPEEFAAIMEVVDEAMRLNSEGGDLREIWKNTYNKLDELWPLLQSMKI